MIARVPRWSIWLVLLLLAGGALLHLDADFPNHSRWIDDGAKFTDEGWWASGAIHHMLTGHWLVPGDYNPMIAVPFWSVLMEFLFHFTGISIGVARATAFGFTIGTVLVCGALMRRDHRWLAPLLMLLIGTSPVLYFFSRLAILEPALIFFVCAAALSVYSKRPPGVGRGLLCGVLFTLAMLTKTSAIFLAPAVFYLMWFPHHRLWNAKAAEDVRVRGRWLSGMAVAALSFVGLYGLYWLLVIHTHPVDIHVFYHETPPSLGWYSVEKAVRVVYRSFTWVDPILFPMAALAILLALRKLPELWQDPLFGFAILFFLGYATFMVLHFDAEPHYFDVMSIPVTILVVLLLGVLETRMPGAARAASYVVLIAVLWNIGYVVAYLIHPEYTFRDACLQIRRQIAADPAAKRLVIGHGAIESTYFTGIPALDDLGALPMEQKIQLYGPGWAVVWSDNIDTLHWPAVASRYSFVQVGQYPVFDNPGRRFLWLFRIEPKP
jgi:4-amino-4-deoxy-L-arabinose transferase-like glycosyltransferase